MVLITVISQPVTTGPRICGSLNYGDLDANFCRKIAVKIKFVL